MCATRVWENPLQRGSSGLRILKAAREKEPARLVKRLLEKWRRQTTLQSGGGALSSVRAETSPPDELLTQLRAHRRFWVNAGRAEGENTGWRTGSYSQLSQYRAGDYCGCTFSLRACSLN